jgi:hypothetical protein
VDRHRFDDLIEDILVTDESFVIENGSATFIALWHSMVENSVIGVLKEAKRRLLIHTVLTGGQALADTVTGFKSLAETCDSRNVIVWIKNISDWFSGMERNSSTWLPTVSIRTRRRGWWSLHKRSPDTFGRDIEEMIIRKLTFDEVLQAGGLTLMSKQRLRMVQTQTLSQLEELNLLPPGPEEKLSA